MTLIVHTDGGSRGNPGPAASAFIITDSSGKVIVQSGKFLGVTTNNQAEYQAVLLALTWINKNLPEGRRAGREASDRTGVDSGSAPVELMRAADSSRPTSITFYLDSELVARQLSGQYKIKSKGLLPLAFKIKNIQNSLNTQSIQIFFHSVPRRLNKPADRLVNQILDAKLSSAISSGPPAF